jgi:protein TonB
MAMATRSDRIKAAAIAAVFELALAYILVTGLAPGAPRLVRHELHLVGILPPPPQPEPQPPPPRPKPQPKAPEKEGAAAPPNLKSIPTEIVRPPPPLPIRVPPPVVAAPIAGRGAAPTAGAAPVPGPGTGAGGYGNGTGSGTGGNGTGGGGEGSPPRWIRGRIRDRDYPPGAGEAGISGTVEVVFTVDTDGHARDCRIRHSSGARDLDYTTCELIEERFRYEPATDGYGRPVPSRLIETHEWVIDRDD